MCQFQSVTSEITVVMSAVMNEQTHMVVLCINRHTLTSTITTAWTVQHHVRGLAWHRDQLYGITASKLIQVSI